MNKEFLTTIIIPSYNSFKTIAYTIKHLLDQDAFSYNDEIIIVDSSDDLCTKEFLKTINNDAIKVIISGIKVMPAIQRNIGVKNAKGDLLVFIDSDAYPEENWLGEIKKAYSLGWKAGGGGYLIPDFQRNNKIALAQYYFEFGEFIPYGNSRVKKIMPSCNMFCDRDLFVSLEGFPEIRASEDGMFCLKAGYETDLIYLPKANVFHIFREDMQDFLNNQFLIGKYIYIFRRNFYNNFYLRGFVFYLLAPIMFIYKFIRRFFMILKAGRLHIRLFINSFRYFIAGNFAWFRGFMNGRKSFKTSNVEFSSFV